MDFYFRNGEPFAGHVQISRLARNLNKQLRPEASHDECLDLAACLLGSENYHNLLKRASDPDIRGWDRREAEKLLESEAIKRGSRFPGKLPPRFDVRWQRQAFQLVEGALNDVRPGGLELVALIGPSGSGKTLLAEHLVDRMGGFIVDVGQASFIDMQMLKIKAGDRILVFDQSSEPVPEFREARGLAKSMRAPTPLTTLSALRKARRVRHTILPLDDSPAVGQTGATMLRDMLAKNPGLTLVATFATEREAVEATRYTVQIMNGNPASTYAKNWQRMHVVSLEHMGRRTIELQQAPANASLSG